jgi:LacI family transcriptional regulator
MKKEPPKSGNEKTRSILLMLGCPDHRFERGVARFAREAGWHLSLDGIYGMNPPWGWKGDGCLAPCNLEETARFVASLNVPVVDLHAAGTDQCYPSIGEDNFAIGELAADYYLRKGFCHFAVYRQTEDATAQARMEGFVQKVRTAGHVVHDLFWAKESSGSDTNWLGRRRWLTAQLSKKPKPLGIFCIDDRIAINLIEVCLDAGFEIPYQVSVLGVGDMNVAGNCSAIPLSSVCIDTEGTAYRAAAMLNDLLEGRNPEPQKIQVPPVGIVERRSTSTIAVQHPAGQTAVRYMLEHFREPIKTKTAAKSAHLSTRQLNDITRDELGVSAAHILEALRLHEAMKVLMKTDYTMDGIATETGLSSRVQLERIFKRHFGVTPSAWKKARAGTPATELPTFVLSKRKGH